MLTIVAAPVYVDAAAIVAGKLSEGETRGVRWGQRSDRLVPKTAHFTGQMMCTKQGKWTNHKRRVRLTDRHSHHPGHTSRKSGCSAR